PDPPAARGCRHPAGGPGRRPGRADPGAGGRAAPGRPPGRAHPPHREGVPAGHARGRAGLAPQGDRRRARRAADLGPAADPGRGARRPPHREPEGGETMTDERDPTHPRLSRWQRQGPILTLVVLSPMIGEVLFGATRLSFIFVLVPEIMVWGCGTLIIRDLVRRWRAGWLSLL